ncbi:MAG: carboxypeptidase-like regulatory domain-containing protein [Ginsengibacter sp.]
MKLTFIFIATLLLLATTLCGQTRFIQGRVISQDLEPLPDVHIKNKDTILFGKTDINGRFKIEIPQQTQTLVLSWVGLERTNIKLKNDCDTLEIIMLYAATYDFMSPKKIDRQRLKQFKRLPELHFQAYDKGLFSKDTICYSNEFEPDKPYFDEIKRQMIKKETELKQIFEKVNIGDTIKIPFNEQSRHDGTDSATLFSYSAFTDYITYDCMIKGIVVGKNKKHKGYNLVYTVINCDKCKPSNIYKGKTMKTDEVFEYNMRKYKLFID